VDADVAFVATAVVPFVTAAVSAYGSAIFSRIEEVAANATIDVGGQVLRRLLRRNESEGALKAAVQDLTADPTDEDRVANLRLQIRKILESDKTLAAELVGMVRATGVTITASGDGAVAAQSITGVVVTGNDAHIAR